MRDNKKYVVKGLARESAKNYKFKNREGQMISIANYWNQAYTRLQHPDLPCLDVSKSRQKVTYLPLEVCEVVPGQRVQKLSDEQTRTVITQSATKPEERKNKIIDILHKANLTNDRAVRQYNINMDNRMINVN